MADTTNSKKSFHCKNHGMRRFVVVVTIGIALLSWFYTTAKPVQPKLCGSPGGPPITAKRVYLSDGRYLAYSESGVPKEDAKYKIIFSHGFSGSRLTTLRASTEIMEELGVYMVGYDRAGYGESDPNPYRSLRREALDVEELADALELGPKFFVIGFSLGGHSVWASLKYMPERLAGAALLAPVINYRWPGFPRNLSTEAYNGQPVGDQWTFRVTYYAPWLLNWWMNQPWLPSSSVVKGTTSLPNKLDARLHMEMKSSEIVKEMKRLATQQGVHESLHRDMMVMFGKWEFDPMDLPPPNIPVHLWQGDEDGLVPVTVQRYICHRLRWIDYHELPSTGHFLTMVPGFGDTVLKTLLA
ncbi:hypothetical protein QJS10_CPB20g01649 [Acorus calamus]|uniref:AB hydrolase-1 domain-containing protein n=1 Tax=Acorus calamus TaxID=4465 RepID=A0AAV9CA13_ACOCL|nr:hypothetical protein QJS10_CPB20g01649 [Acorus calamus]